MRDPVVGSVYHQVMCDILEDQLIVLVAQAVKPADEPNTWTVGGTKSISGQRLLPITPELPADIRAFYATRGSGRELMAARRRAGSGRAPSP